MRISLRSGCIQPLMFSLTLCAIANAAPVNGSFGTVAAGVISFANGSNTMHFLDFCPMNPATPLAGVTCPTATASQFGIGEFLASGGTGSFSSIPPYPPGPATMGTLKDMLDNGSSSPYTTFPAGVLVSINNFLRISTLPQYNFRAEFLVPQTCAPSGIVACIGPFVLTQVADNVAVQMTVRGTVLDTTNAQSPAYFTYVITGRFNSTSISTVAAAMQTTGGMFSNTWSGSLTTTPMNPGSQGCTPGFWKQSFHYGFWTGYLPAQTVGSVFTGFLPEFASQKLVDALQNAGGPGLAGAEGTLLRAAVAALLNASNNGVNYGFVKANIIDAVNAAVGTGNRDTVLQLAKVLDDANNGTGGCPLSGQNP